MYELYSEFNFKKKDEPNFDAKPNFHQGMYP